MKVQCPYCDNGNAILKSSNIEILQDNEGIPCKCNECKKEFVVFITIAEEPK